MDQIPDEILSDILLLTSYKIQQTCISIVCRRWCRLIIPDHNYEQIQEKFLAACVHINGGKMYINETFQLYGLYTEIMDRSYRSLFFHNIIFRVGFIGSIQKHFGRTILLDRVLIKVSELIDSRASILGFYKESAPDGTEIDNDMFMQLFAE